MNELERALVRLGEELELPPAPDLTGAVRGRLRRRRRSWPAVAAVAAAVAVAFAVPQSRGAILRFFHLGAVQVELVDRLPALPETAPLGRRVPAAAAAFPLLRLDGREPEAVYTDGAGYWLRYPGALLYELRTGDGILLKKVAGSTADVAYVPVGGDPGLWIGTRHAVFLPGGRARAAGHVLVWQRGPLTLRLEARVTRAQAVELAEQVRR